MSLSIKYSYIKGQFEAAMGGLYTPVAEAATAAIGEAGAMLKLDARAEIAKGGFSKRWQNALRVNTYPAKGKASVNAAAFLFHKIPYADVFETGATIRGKPKLWLPLKTTPKNVAGQRMTAGNYVKNVGPLISIKSKTGKPLLAARIRTTEGRAKKGLSISQLRRGTAGKQGTIRAVPLFIGVDSVLIRKKFDTTAAAERARDALPGLYFKHLKGD